MEPITYMVCKKILFSIHLIATFYAAVGTFFYLYYKKDFEMASAYDMFTDRKYNRIVKKNRFDTKKIEFLENYISELKDQIGILKNEEIEKIAK